MTRRIVRIFEKRGLEAPTASAVSLWLDLCEGDARRVEALIADLARRDQLGSAGSVFAALKRRARQGSVFEPTDSKERGDDDVLMVRD